MLLHIFSKVFDKKITNAPKHWLLSVFILGSIPFLLSGRNEQKVAVHGPFGQLFEQGVTQGDSPVLSKVFQDPFAFDLDFQFEYNSSTEGNDDPDDKAEKKGTNSAPLWHLEQLVEQHLTNTCLAQRKISLQTRAKQLLFVLYHSWKSFLFI